MIELTLLIQTETGHARFVIPSPENAIRGDALCVKVHADPAIPPGNVYAYTLCNPETGYDYRYDFRATYPIGTEDFRLSARIALEDQNARELWGAS